MPFRHLRLRTPRISGLAAIFAAILLPCAASAQVVSSWLGGDGNWYDASKWSNGIPREFVDEATIDSAAGVNSIVTVNSPSGNPSQTSLHKLTITAGDTVQITPVTGLSMYSKNGVGPLLHIDGTLNLALEGHATALDSHLAEGTAITFSGSGKVLLGSPGQHPIISGNIANGITIEGHGELGRLVNEHKISINNSGTIHANVPGEEISLQVYSSSGPMSFNSGTIKASNGGIIRQIYGPITQTGSGSFLADGPGSKIRFTANARVFGGSITATNGAIIDIGDQVHFHDLTVTGPVAVDENVLDLYGTITNNGAMTVYPKAGGISRIETSRGSETTTITGTGEIVLERPFTSGQDFSFGAWFGTGALIIDTNQTIRGRGFINRADGSSGVAMTNRGTIIADRAGDELTLNPRAMVNLGTVRAVNGGILSLRVTEMMTNIGGTIEALDGGVVRGNLSHRILGGLIRNVGGHIALNKLTLVDPAGDANDSERMRLQGELTLETSQSMRLIGTITNESLLNVRGETGDSTVLIGETANPNVTLNGGGTISLGHSSGAVRSFIHEGVAAAQLTNVNNTIRGFGQLGTSTSGALQVVNDGTISGDVANATLALRLSALDNSGGTIQSANSGTLTLNVATTINNTGGFLKALNGGTTRFATTATVDGGTWSNSGGAFDIGSATIRNPELLQGLLHLSHAKTATLIGNTINNTGTIELRNTSTSSTGTGTILKLGAAGSPEMHLVGGGEIVLGRAADGGIRSLLHEGPDDTLLHVDAQTIRGFGEIGDSARDQLNLINNNLINADAGGFTLAVNAKTLTNSPGKFLRSSNGGTLQLTSMAPIANVGATIEATTNGLTKFGAATEVLGGTLRSVGANFDLGFATLRNPGSGLTLQGPLHVSNNRTATLVGGTIINEGSIQLRSSGSATRLRIGGTGEPNISLIGGGEIVLGDVSLGGTLGTVEEGPDNALLSLDAQTLRGFGQVGDAARDQLSVVNNTLINADANGRTLAFDTRTVVNSPTKVMKASNGGTLDISTPVLTNTNAQVVAESGSTVAFTGAGTEKVVGGSLTSLGGGTLAFTDGIKVEGGASVENYGTMSVGRSTARTYDASVNDSVALKNFGLIRKVNTGDYTLNTLLASTGAFSIEAGRLRLFGNGIFVDANVSIPAGEFRMENGATFSFDGANNVFSGAGLASLSAASLAMDSDARLTVARLDVNGASTVSGGELRVTNNISFSGTGSNVTLSDLDLRVQEGAVGSSAILGTGALRLNDGTVFENKGAFTISGSGPWSTNGGGLLRNDAPGTLNFAVTMTMGVPCESTGMIKSTGARDITFTRGGTLKGGADLVTDNSSSDFVFTGATPLTIEGQDVEILGPGTTIIRDGGLHLHPHDPTTTADDAQLDAASRIAFQNTSAVSGSGEVHTSWGFRFEGANTTIDGATLRNSAQGTDSSTWSASGGHLTFLNGGRFINDGRFLISASVGSITGDNATLFTNGANGRLIHDTGATTNFNMPFVNDGVLEFLRGTFNFQKSYSGTGGIAASGGARVSLSASAADASQLPRLLEVNGSTSRIDITFPNAGSHTISMTASGGQIVAAGGLNLVAAGAGNVLSHNGGAIVAAGGLNVDGATATANGGLLQFAGGVISHNGGQILIDNSGNLVAAGAGNILIDNSGNLVAAGGGNVIAEQGDIVAAGAGNIVAAGAGNVIAQQGDVLSHNGGAIVAAGAGNIVAAGAGNIVAAGAGNFADARANKTASAVTSASSATGVIKAEAGGFVKALGGGTIVAQQGGLLTGSGTFQGPGRVESGGRLVPGSSAGTLTWTGNLLIDAGGVLEVEIGGTTAGTQHDVVNVSGAFALNGALQVQIVRGFGSTVQATDAFDIVNAGAPISGALPSRVGIAGSNATFAVQLVNGGKTLRLTDYQLAAPTFNSWASKNGLSGPAAAMTADPDGDGLVNLLEYALGKDPNANNGSGTSIGTVESGGQKFLSLSYTRPTGADAPSDLTYAVERATALAPTNWSSSSVDLVTHSVVQGPGSVETITVRSAHPMRTTPREFLHLKVTATQQ